MASPPAGAQTDLGSWRSLVKRVVELSNAFLPPQDATGTYSRADYDRTSAFLLLAHAEIQSHIEENCRALAHAAVTQWEADSKPRAAVIALVAFAHADGEAAVPKSSDGTASIRRVVAKAKSNYSAIVHHNNGVKSKDVLKLVIPVGVRETSLSAGWLADMDTFGSSRGDQAHLGVGARRPPDPADARKLIARLLMGLRAVDRELANLATE